MSAPVPPVRAHAPGTYAAPDAAPAGEARGDGDRVRRNQAFALRLLADLTRMAPPRRRALRAADDDPAYREARAALEAALRGDDDRRAHLARFLAGADLVIACWDDPPEVADTVAVAVRALVLHSEPELAGTFRVLYAPVQPHVPFEALLLG